MQADKITTLQAQIQSLADLHSCIPSLRQIPPLLLETPVTNGLPLSTQSLRPQFHHIKDISDTIRTDPIQEALRTARDTLRADTTDLHPNFRRENRKRRRPPSPGSPQPYVALERKTTSLFPPGAEGIHALKFEGLSSFIDEFNNAQQAKLHLWKRTHGTTQANEPIIVRLTIPDVLIAYVTLVTDAATSDLFCESLTAFGPRERKSPHSQSDFSVYRILSQQAAKMLHSHPRVSVQGVMNLLCSYSGLFVDRCVRCGRVLSTEGHVPPVVRIWDDGGWSARHVACRLEA
ncbi:hypothetical protein Hypma_008093 [Hypsizygus marmoreus]|uniref:Mediator of RNA polymerase II transcription subunit 27 n=1 Tax=Hypsizygus marmoreus TaxID=39966 RepID=A0A369JUC0_HYPMA|nr:hypothetical protein Hypma_008093 [Hypsizygus marmoreus]